MYNDNTKYNITITMIVYLLYLYLIYDLIVSNE